MKRSGQDRKTTEKELLNYKMINGLFTIQVYRLAVYLGALVNKTFAYWTGCIQVGFIKRHLLYL